MSKIFEALQKTGVAIPETEIPLLTGDPASSSEQQDRNQASGSIENSTQATHEVSEYPAVAMLRSEVARWRPEEVRIVPVQLAASNPVLPFDTRSRHAVEQYRMIRTKIHHHPAKPQIITVTSSGSGDGKTVTSINITGAMSLKAGAQVLLIDGDLRRSSVARMLGVPAEPGLTDVLSQACELDQALIRIQQFPNCYVLPAGRRSENPPELLDSMHWRNLCDGLRQRFQYVILDSPPVASVADYDLIEAASDGIVMVVRPNYTNRATFKKAMTSIPQAKMLGFILNDFQNWFLWNVQSGYSYAYYDSLDMSQMQQQSQVGSE